MFLNDTIFNPEVLGKKKLTLLSVYREHKELIDKIAKYAGIDAALAQLLGIAIKKFFTNPDYASLEFGNLFALVKRPRKVNINLKNQGYVPENLFGRELLDKLVNEKGLEKFTYTFVDIKFMPRELVKDFIDTSKYQAVVRELRNVLTDREYRELLKKALEEDMESAEQPDTKKSGEKKNSKSVSLLARIKATDIPDVRDDIDMTREIKDIEKDINSASGSLKYMDKDYDENNGEGEDEADRS